MDGSISNDGSAAEKVELSCPKGKITSWVKFASFGGSSGNLQQGRYHHTGSSSGVRVQRED